jgi:predicted AAA+ superfamily ATPase
MAFERHYVTSLIQRLEEQRQFIQVLAGPRQVGKTTIIRQILPKLTMPSSYLSCDDALEGNGVWIRQQWESARVALQHSNNTAYILVIDEIQKLSNWSETVKALWDEDTRLGNNIKVILLGSSRLMLQQGLTESLAGRFEMHYVSHWSFAEMEAAFGWTFQQFIWFGGYPGAATLIHDEERWKRYISDSLIETSILKDILMLTRVDKPALMRQLFDLGCNWSGQILSYNKMLGQFHDAGNTTTLANYLHLLSQAGLLSGLEKFSGNKIMRRASSPKFQVQNTALISPQRSETLLQIQQQPEQWGRIVESAVGAHLLNNALTDDYNLYYWLEGNDEVDFVMEKRGKIIALEVKSGHWSSNKGMSTFDSKFKPDRALLLGMQGISIEDFLRLRPVELF